MNKNKYQNVYNEFKNHKKTEGFELRDISEIFVPFWYCKQEVVVEQDIEIDRFSKIILELINSGILTHTEICSFLGIKEGDFVTMQFHYLLKNELIEESNQAGKTIYSITRKGISFLERKEKIQNIEITEFEYFYNDLSREYFNIEKPIDKNISQNQSKGFLGYVVAQTHRIKQGDIEQVDHKNRPSLNKIKQSDFASFFNEQKSDMTFYDFEDKKIELHKRSVLFLRLEYENDEYQKEYEVRQFKKSVNKFQGYVLEEKLSLDLMKYYKTE